MIISIANQKGGTGKTTTTLFLSYILAKKGCRVLAIDFDPQACLTTVLRGQGKSISEIIQKILQSFERRLREADDFISIDEIPANVRVDDFVEIVSILDAKLGLICSDNSLASVERQLNDTIGGERILAKFLGTADGYDVILIDTQPALNALTINALVASDYVLVPVDLTSLGLVGFKVLGGVVKTVKEQHNRRLKWLGVLPTRFERTREIMKNYENLRSKLVERAGIKVYPPIPKSVAVERIHHVKSLDDLLKSVKTAHELLKAYENVAEDIISEVKVNE